MAEPMKGIQDLTSGGRRPPSSPTRLDDTDDCLANRNKAEASPTAARTAKGDESRSVIWSKNLLGDEMDAAGLVDVGGGLGLVRQAGTGVTGSRDRYHRATVSRSSGTQQTEASSYRAFMLCLVDDIENMTATSPEDGQSIRELTNSRPPPTPT